MRDPTPVKSLSSVLNVPLQLHNIRTSKNMRKLITLEKDLTSAPLARIPPILKVVLINISELILVKNLISVLFVRMPLPTKDIWQHMRKCTKTRKQGSGREHSWSVLRVHMLVRPKRTLWNI
jgi:hypothetical protein